MAESVQKILEKSTPFFCMLKKSELFKLDELRRLIGAVRNYENKLHSNPKTLENYNLAIRFEVTIFQDFLKRYRDKHAKRDNPKEKYMFIQRIFALYKRGLIYFKDDWNFNMRYFETLEIYRFLPDYAHIAHDHMMSMIQTFSHEPLIYRRAAGWFCSCKKYLDASNALMRGQARHPKNLQIYLDLFELEVSIKDEIPGTQERLEKYVDQAICHVDSYQFFFALMELMDEHDVLRSALTYVRDKMVSKYRDEPMVWDFLAKRELADEAYVTKGEVGPDTLRGINHMILRYQEGIFKVPEDKKHRLWKCFLGTISNTVREYWNEDTAKLLKSILGTAEDSGVKLEEYHYVNLIECETDPKRAAEIFRRGIKKYNNKSVTLWLAYLQHVASQGEASIVFEKAVITLGLKSFKIFDYYENLLLLRECDDEKMEIFYERAVSHPCPKIVEAFKRRYIVWAITTKDVKEVRDTYFRLAENPPYSKAMHEVMFIAEQVEITMDQKSDCRMKVLNLWIEQFGHEDVDVWFQKLELLREEKGPNMKQEIRELYQKAVKNLDVDKIETFIERFFKKQLAINKDRSLIKSNKYVQCDVFVDVILV